MVLAANLYVDDFADFTITNDQGSIGLDAGDTVTWGTGDTAVAGLTFGTTAFGTLPAAVTAASAGDTITLGAGTYTLSAQLSLNKSGLTVQGVSRDSVVVETTASRSTEARLIQIDATNVSLRSLTMAGWQADTVTATAGRGYQVWVNGTSGNGATIDDVTFDNDNMRVSVYIGTANDITITDSIFEGTLYRYAIRGAGERMNIARNHFDVSFYEGGPIYMEYGANTSGTIADNLFDHAVGVTVLSADASGSFKGDGSEMWTIANWQPQKITATGLSITGNTFTFTSAENTNAVTGARPQPIAILNDPALVASGPITITNNSFTGYGYQPLLVRPTVVADEPRGYALRFDGSQSFASFTMPDSLGDEGTFSAWVKIDSDATSRRNQIIEGPGNGGLEVQYRNNSSGQFYGTANPANSVYSIMNGSASTTAQSWTNLQFTWQKADGAGGTMRLYVNGTEVTYAANFGPTFNQAKWANVLETLDGLFYVGRDPGDTSRMFDGWMDDIAFFNTALDGTARDAVRSGTDITKTALPSLVTYWNPEASDVAAVTLSGSGGTTTPLTLDSRLSTTPDVVSFKGGTAGAVTFANNTITLTAGSMRANLTGGSSNDTLQGTPGNDVLAGGDGADSFTPGLGADTVDGGAGIDEVIFVGNYADYSISVVNNNLVVTALDASSATTISNVEDLAFADRTIYLAGASRSIQSLIDTAQPGDVVLATPGTYTETLSIGVAGVTVRSIAGAATTVISGADAEGATVRFAANNVRLEGFTIDNQNASDGRAIAPQGFSGGQIVGNTIKNAVRGIQGDFYGRPTNVTITGNTFEATVAYGIAGTEDMSITALSGNIFNTSEEAIGLGAGVSGATPTGLMTNNTFSLSAAGDGDTYGVKDYASTPNTIYVKAGDSLQAAINGATFGDTVLVPAGTWSPITIGVAGVTVKTTAGALIQGADAEGATVRFAANNVRLEGFTIDNENAADGRAIAPQGSSGGEIVGNTIKNAVRGIQGDFYGRPTNVTITGNTFEATVSYGIAGTEDMSITALSGNTFNTSEEAIGLGAGVSGVTPAGLMASNTFSLSAAGDGDTYGVKDYRDNTIYVKAGDSLQSAINGATFGDTVLVPAGTWSPISIGVAGVTVKTTEAALFQGADAEGATVRFAANNVRLEGFTIDNQNAADGRAIAPQGFSGGQIVGNTIKNAVRGIQGDFYGRPSNVTITGNTFEATVAYGVAGTEDMSITALSGNTFNTSEEAIGLGAGVSGVTPAGLMANNTFNLSAAGDGDTYGVKDYASTPNTIYVKAGDSLQAAINGASAGDTILVAAGTYSSFLVPADLPSITIRSIDGPANTIIQGAAADGVTVRFGYVHPYYVPHLEGFTIDNQNATDGAAIVTAGFAGGSFANNTIRNAVRGIQGGGYNWLTFTGNTFESTVARGIVGTDYSLIPAISGNTFSTSEEAISLNADVSWRPDPNDIPRQLDASDIYNLLAAQTFVNYAGDALRDYRTDSTYVPVKLTSDTGVSPSDRITSDGSLTVTPAIGETIEYSVDNGLTWSDSFTAVEGPNAVMARRVGSTRTDSEPKAFVFTLDTVKPTVAIAASRDGLPVAALKAGETATITFTLSESATSFTVGDVTVAFGELSGFTGSGSVYTATFTPSVNIEAEAAVSVAADTFTDTAGNENLASSEVTLQVDTLVPEVVSITSSQPVLKANQTALITFTLNTPSNTFTAGDVVTTGGTLSNFAGSGSVYTATFTPTANFSGVGTVRVLAGSFFDLAGNRSTAAFDLSPTIDVQTNGPYVVSITAATNPIRVGAGSSQITVTLNKYVPAFTLAHLQVTPGAGTFGALNRVGSSASYRTLFTPAANYVGTVAITVADDAFADTAGNSNVGGSLATPLVVDLVAPDITSITPSLTNLKAGETTNVTFSFNEPVVGFTLSDVTVAGGTLSGFTGSGASYSAVFTPRTNSTAPGTISVAANRFTDAAGNPNVQRDLSPPIAINTVVPSMTIRQRLPVLKAGQSTTMTFQVRGEVSGSDPFTADDISLSPGQGSLTNFSGPSFVRGISTYTALYTAPATAFSGSVGLSVPANSFKVVGNNVNGNALATLAIKIDAIAPTPVISSTTAALKIGQTATIDFTVDGETGGLIGFEAGDITLTPSSGTLSAPTRVGSTSVYRSTYTPAVGFEGTVTIALAASKFTDAAGNPNTIAAPITIAVDTSAPAAPTVSLVNDTGILGNDKITSDARLQTTGTEAGAAVNYWTTSALTTPWTPALAVQGSNTVYVTQTDTAGNPSPSNNFFTFEYRTTAPVVTSITLPAASTGLRAGAFLQLSVRFDRPVFVTNATADGPFITIGGFTTGANNRNAVYSSGSGTTTLVFRYRVVAGDKAPTGITFPSSAITLEAASLADAAGNAAALGFTLPSRRPLTRVNA